MKWRILVSGKCSPAENMAIDEAIFQNLIEGRSYPTIRFYDWDPPTLSYGYHQKVTKEIDFAEMKKLGFGYVRRPTGGRMVLHNNEVTYAIIAPISEHLAGSVLESYSAISKALAEGLKLIGIEVNFEKGSLSSAHQRQSSNPCFASSSRFELNYKTKKIIGSAQIRKKNALLQHGSILLNYDQSQLAYVLPDISLEQKERLANYLQKKTIAINQIIEEKIDFWQAVNYFIKGFKKNWPKDIFFQANELIKSEKEVITNLMYSKYLTEKWNKRN